jgi:hypothetical protein
MTTMWQNRSTGTRGGNDIFGLIEIPKNSISKFYHQQGCYLRELSLIGLAFVLLGIETHGKAMGIGDEDPAARFCVAPPPVTPAPTSSAAGRTVMNPAEYE